MVEYKSLEEETIVDLAKNGDDKAYAELLSRYKKTINYLAKDFFYSPYNSGAQEDFIQVGNVALVSAVKTYDRSRKVLFRTYASRVIHSRLIDHYRSLINDINNLRETNVKNNQNEEFGEKINEIEDTVNLSQEEMTENEAGRDRFYNILNEFFNEDEMKIITLYIKELQYKEIANKLGITTKKVDNTITKLKKTIRDNKARFDGLF